MKARTKSLAMLAAATLTCVSFGLKANASLIDLGERDLASRLSGKAASEAFIEMDQGLPSGTLVYLNSFDADTGFTNDGVVDSSHFGATLIDGDTNGEVSWNLETAGFQLSYVFLKDGRNSTSGPYLYRLYGVTPDEVFNSLSDQSVTVNGGRFITYISFWGVPGSPAVPEGGTTLILLLLSLGLIAVIRRLHHRGTVSA